MQDIFQVQSNLTWLNSLPRRIETVYLGKLLYNGVFNEIHNQFRTRWFRRRLVKAEHIGVWGWNTWCGVHTFPVITGPAIHARLAATFDVGFQRTEPATGLLPHAIVHRDGIFGSEWTYKCYAGSHGESYNLDNILCWAKMAMEYYLATNDGRWFTPAVFGTITHTIDYILTHFRGMFHPDLIFAGIEGDWTECTNWLLDNADVTVNMLNALSLVIECQQLLGFLGTTLDYNQIRSAIITAFNHPVNDGGFWDPEQGFYIHGNNGKGTEIHGNKYFEATVNYFALLWGIASPEYETRIWEYIDKHPAIEHPYPVLTNFHPRTGARRTAYGHTVTNGDIWMVLGGHAAAARLQAGFAAEGTEMFLTIVNYEQQHGVLHNNIYPDGRFNDAWDPEIANYGALYAPFVLGILGIHLRAEGLEFHIRPLADMTDLLTTIYFDTIPYELHAHWQDQRFHGTLRSLTGESALLDLNQADFLLARTNPPLVMITGLNPKY